MNPSQDNEPASDLTHGNEPVSDLTHDNELISALLHDNKLVSAKTQTNKPAFEPTHNYKPLWTNTTINLSLKGLYDRENEFVPKYLMTRGINPHVVHKLPPNSLGSDWLAVPNTASAVIHLVIYCS